jgi:hypothetical protein
MSNVLAFEPKRTCVFLADKKRHITDRFFSVKASQEVNREKPIIVEREGDALKFRN